LEQVVDLRLAAAEEVRVAGVEVEEFQAAIRALAGERGSRGVEVRLPPPDAVHEAAERLILVDRVAELDPGGGCEELEQLRLLGLLDTGQQYGDDPERVLAVLDPTADGQ